MSFDKFCLFSGLPIPVAEYRFDDRVTMRTQRRWRFDWAWPDRKVALEVNGGVFMQGKHSRGIGQLKDFEKWSEAATQGWRIIHATPAQLESAETLDWIRRCLQ